MKVNFYCANCNKLTTKRKREKGRVLSFCSIECSSQSRQSERWCKNCNKKLLYDKANKRTNKVFCSRECAIVEFKKGRGVDFKKKLSDAKKGVPLSDHHINSLRGIKKPLLRGSNHFNYKRGEYCNGKIRPRGRTEYREWRRKVFERDNYTCKHCNVRGGYLEADHIKPWCNYPELRYCVDNGRTLCKDCHKRTDTYGKKAQLA